MKKKDKIPEAKSSLFFKIVLFAVFVCAFVFVWFAGYVMADTNFQRAREKTSVVIAMEPQAPAVFDVAEVIEVRSEPAVEVIEAQFEPMVEVVAVQPEPVVEVVEEQPEPVVEVVEEQPVYIVEDIEQTESLEPAQTLSQEPLQEAALPAEPKVFYVAVVIDDMGISPKHTKEILSVHAPITTAFLTYGNNLHTFIKESTNAGHEVIMHTPMEPEGPADLAPDTLKVSMTDEQIKTAFLNMLSKFDGVYIKGINNHMGSLFTESAEKLDVLMSVLKEKNMYFLDSKTSKYSQGANIAAMEGVDYIARDVFLDNDNDYEKILKQFKKTENIARNKGFAVAIGHPKSQTFAALKNWLQTLDDQSIKLVHLNKLIALKKASEK